MRTFGREINNWQCVIFDIDGTLLDNRHRVGHLKKEPKDWETYNAMMHLDTPVPTLVALARVLRQNYALVLSTGREEKFREITHASLKSCDVWHDGLWMRRSGDFRPDTEIKREHLAEIRYVGFNPQFVVEDRPSVVRMFREEGLVCLACAEGEF